MILDRVNFPQDIKKLTVKELYALAEEIREYIRECVNLNGGHLGSNLGVVELTLALHYVFDFSTDRLVFDVGHQCYTHKILTGRKDDLKNLRNVGGASGFPKTEESIYDAFNTGHASTSISVGLGLCRARDLRGEKHNIISLIGDGALTGGLAYEALNDLGGRPTKQIIILNDNEQSIEKNVGGLAIHTSLLRMSNRYVKAKRRFERHVAKVPILGKPTARLLERKYRALRAFFLPQTIFNELGLTTIGKLDGHNIKRLIRVFKRAKGFSHPVVIIVKTDKGKGHINAQASPENFHSVSANFEDGIATSGGLEKTFSQVAGDTLLALKKQHSDIVTITPAMTGGSGLTQVAKKFPTRFFDVGIAEGHAGTFAAALAAGGVKPYYFCYSSFLQRSYDQIVHDIALSNTPVVMCIERAGIVGGDGETHQGVFDISFLAGIPNITILSPATLEQLKLCLEFSYNFKTPIAIRYPRGTELTTAHKNDSTLSDIVLGKWEIVRDNRQVATHKASSSNIYIIAEGNHMQNLAKQISDEIYEQKQIRPTIVNPLFLKPIDTDFLSTIEKGAIVAVLESGIINGGLNTYISHFFNENNIAVKFLTYGIPDKFLPHGSVKDLMNLLELQPTKIANDILKKL